MDEEPVQRPLPHPVRCEDCANSVRALRACRFDRLHGWPGVKPYGCLYYVRRGRDRVEQE